MPIVPISLGARSNPGRHGAAGAARLINCYAENAGGEGKTEWPLYAVSGLRTLVDLPNGGGIRAMITLDNSLYVVAGRVVFQVTEGMVATQIGGVPTDGPVTMARNMRESSPQIGVVSGGNYYLIENNAMTQVTDADLPPPIAIAHGDGYFWLPTTRSRWFVTSLQQGGAIDALEFATAEASPDNNVGIAELNRDAVLFGERSLEFWQNVGSDPFPYARSATVAIGCLSGPSIARLDRTVAFVAHDGTVRILDGYSPTRISTHAVEETIRKESSPGTISACSWTEGGHSILAVSGTDWTWCYDLATGYWHERESFGQGRWRVSQVVRFAGMNIAGDATTGRLYELTPDTYDEAGYELVVTVQTPPVHAYPNPIRVNRLWFDPIPGVGLTTEAAPNGDPQIMIDVSRDNGATFGNQRFYPIGRQGSRMKRVMMTRLGLSGEDGFVIRASVSASVIKGFTGASADLDKLDA